MKKSYKNTDVDFTLLNEKLKLGFENTFGVWDGIPTTYPNWKRIVLRPIFVNKWYIKIETPTITRRFTLECADMEGYIAKVVITSKGAKVYMDMIDLLDE
jgi:hypothetical protein